MIGESSRRAHRRTINPAFPCLRLSGFGGFATGAELNSTFVIGNFHRDSPSSRATLAGTICEIGAAQTPPGRQKGNGLKEIGLAGTILAGEHNDIAVDHKIELKIGPEIGQDEPAHLGPAQSSTALKK
jgi:hypothetical protein